MFRDPKAFKFLCAVKGPSNQGKKWSGTCIGCCSFCDQVCKIRTCIGIVEELCCWRRSFIEWLLGKIDEEADRESFGRRRIEFWLKNGFKEGDGSWEGEHIRRLRKRYGKDFGCNLE